MAENRNSSDDMTSKPPQKNKHSANILLILILGCWLLLLYFSGGFKGPG